MAVSKRLRYEILRRDNHACRYCGSTAPDVKLTVDHVVPTALGGGDTADNLVTACAPCNSGKTSSSPDAPLVADVGSDALRWADAMTQAADELRQQQKPKLDYRAAFENAWNSWTYELDGQKKHFDLPADWKNSLETFRTAGLPVEVLPDIVDRAMSNKTVRYYDLFRYCCGIAWRMIGELQDNARRIVGAGRHEATEQLSPLLQAVLDTWAHEWESDHDETVTSEDRAEFAASLRKFATSGVYADGELLIAAAHTGGCEKRTTIQDSIVARVAELRAEVVMEWAGAWVDLAREKPDGFAYTVVEQQVNALLDASVPYSHVRRAALLAAAHHSFFLHEGLRVEHLEQGKAWAYRQQATDAWSRAFRSSAGRWPSAGEEGEFLSHLDRIAADGGFFITDVMPAATSAGAYEDPDLTTCLPRYQSAFRAAAIPLQPAA